MVVTLEAQHCYKVVCLVRPRNAKEECLPGFVGSTTGTLAELPALMTKGWQGIVYRAVGKRTTVPGSRYPATAIKPFNLSV